jgi:hypothetical protein
MLNVSLKQSNKMLYIPSEEKIAEYLRAVVSYYETGSYDLFKHYFINEYKKTVDAIVFIEKAKKNEQTMPTRGEEVAELLKPKDENLDLN